MSQSPLIVGYGLSQQLPSIFPSPIPAKRAPTTRDINYQLGQVWIYNSTAYMLVLVSAGAATWANLEASGGAGIFSSLTVTPGPISLTGTTTINTTGAATTSIGSTTGASGIAMLVGTGNFSLGSAATSTISIGGANQTGTLTIAGGNAAQTVNIAAAGVGDKTINIGADGSIDAIRIGSVTSTSSTTIVSGTAGLTLKGGQILPVTNVDSAASPYALLGTDQFVAVDPTAGVVTIALPAVPQTGRFLTVYDATGQAAANIITIDGGGHNISAGGASAATATLTTAFSSLNLWYNGTIWNAQKVS